MFIISAYRKEYDPSPLACMIILPFSRFEHQQKNGKCPHLHSAPRWLRSATLTVKTSYLYADEPHTYLVIDTTSFYGILGRIRNSLCESFCRDQHSLQPAVPPRGASLRHSPQQTTASFRRRHTRSRFRPNRRVRFYNIFSVSTE